MCFCVQIDNILRLKNVSISFNFFSFENNNKTDNILWNMKTEYEDYLILGKNMLIGFEMWKRESFKMSPLNNKE